MFTFIQMVRNKQKQTQKKRGQSQRYRRIYQKKQSQSSTINAIATTAQNTTPLSVPTYSPYETNASTLIRDDNSPIVVNGVEIPSLCADIDRKNTLEKALEFLTRTKVEENPHHVSRTSPESSTYTARKHRACVCVLFVTLSSLEQRKLYGFQKRQLKVKDIFHFNQYLAI